MKSEGGESSEVVSAVLDVVLSSNVQVLVQEVQGFETVQPTNLLFCTARKSNMAGRY